MRRDTLWLFSVLVALATLVGCGDDDGVTPFDAGSGDPDAASGADGGGVDSGGTMDAGGADAGPGDAGGGGDAGTDAGSPTAGDITFAESCPAFTPCGGDLVGTWRYDGACVTHAEIESRMEGACPDANFVSGTGTVDGTVTFDATTVMRDVSTSISIVVFVPSSCTMGFGCAIVGPAIQTMAMVDSATCVDATGGCDCTIMDTETITESASYTASGNTFENTSTMRRWDYCVDGTDLTLQETTSGDGDDPVEPGIQSLVSET